MSRRDDRTPVAAGAGLAVLWVATILVGLSAGFFFTYEASVTLGLAEVSDVAYVETFQAINETVSNPAFGLVFFGSIPAMLAALATNWRSVSVVSRILMVLALALYLVGLMITGTQNVPLNDELALVDPVTAASASIARAAFEDEWNRLDLYRSIAIGAAFVSLSGAGLLSTMRRETAVQRETALQRETAVQRETAKAGERAHT